MSNPRRRPAAKPRKCVCGHHQKHHVDTAIYSICCAALNGHKLCGCPRFIPRPARVGKGRTK